MLRSDEPDCSSRLRVGISVLEVGLSESAGHEWTMDTHQRVALLPFIHQGVSTADCGPPFQGGTWEFGGTSGPRAAESVAQVRTAADF